MGDLAQEVCVALRVLLELALQLGVALAEGFRLRPPLVHQALQALHLLQQALHLPAQPPPLLAQGRHLILQLPRPATPKSHKTLTVCLRFKK